MASIGASLSAPLALPLLNGVFVDVLPWFFLELLLFPEDLVKGEGGCLLHLSPSPCPAPYQEESQPALAHSSYSSSASSTTPCLKTLSALLPFPLPFPFLPAQVRKRKFSDPVSLYGLLLLLTQVVSSSLKEAPPHLRHSRLPMAENWSQWTAKTRDKNFIYIYTHTHRETYHNSLNSIFRTTYVALWEKKRANRMCLCAFVMPWVNWKV